MNLEKIHFASRIILPEKLAIFSDVFEDISTKKEADEYIGYVKNVLEEESEDFEKSSCLLQVLNNKKNVTVAMHHYRIDEPYDSTIETDEFLKLKLIWKETIA